MSVIAELSIFPLNASTSLSPFVARVLTVIKSSGLSHELGPMGTCIEGSWSEVMDVVDRCYQELEKDCDRIYLTLKVDAHQGRGSRLKSKVRSVEDKLRT